MARPSIDVDCIFPDGRRLAADVVGRDAPSDVAVVRLRVPPADLSAARFGDSDGAEIGEWVLAVGSPLGLEQTITAGIISGRGPLEASEGVAAQVYLQTDAKVNPGNSGGPLVNLDGEVVGLAALISAGPGGSYGYAVPINLVRRTAAALIEGGHMQHPYIGVALRDIRDLDRAEMHRWSTGARSLPPRGSLVTRVVRDTPAARAGLRAGDVITSIDNRDIPTAAELVAIISAQRVGARVVVGVVRRGAALTLPLSVADRPAKAKSPELACRSRRAGSCDGGGALQRQVRDLGGLGQTHGRAPVAGAATHVDLRVAVAVQARQELLLQANEVAERPDLAAVRVSGDLQSDAERRRVEQRPRLVRQQHQLALRIASLQRARHRRRGREAAVSMRGAIVDSAQIEAGIVFANRDPFVAEHANAEPLKLAQPRVGARKVLVIAGNEEDAVARAQFGEWRDRVAQHADAAVDEIAGDRDDVGRERVGAVDDVLDDVAPDRRADVEIGDLGDGQAVVRARQARQTNANPANLHRPQRRSHRDDAQRRIRRPQWTLPRPGQ